MITYTEGTAMKITSISNGKYSKFDALGRNSTTRVIHIFGGGASRCGASKRNSIVQIAEAKAASANVFCERCFPSGKPDEFFEVVV